MRRCLCLELLVSQQIMWRVRSYVLIATHVSGNLSSNRLSKLTPRVNQRYCETELSTYQVIEDAFDFAPFLFDINILIKRIFIRNGVKPGPVTILGITLMGGKDLSTLVHSLHLQTPDLGDQCTMNLC